MLTYSCTNVEDYQHGDLSAAESAYLAKGQFQAVHEILISLGWSDDNKVFSSFEIFPVDGDNQFKVTGTTTNGFTYSKVLPITTTEDE